MFARCIVDASSPMVSRIQLLLLVCGLAACAPDATGSVSSCIPGASAACVCTNGQAGAQVCDADANFSACSCTTGSTASSSSSSSGLSLGTCPSGCLASEVCVSGSCVTAMGTSSGSGSSSRATSSAGPTSGAASSSVGSGTYSGTSSS